MRITYWLASALFLATPLAAQQINPANQIRWPAVSGSGNPTSACTAANYGQPYTDVTGNKSWVCSGAGWVPVTAGTVTVTSNQGVGANGSSGLATVPEVNYQTSGANTAFACQEDHAKGVWDVRCIRSGVSWASNPSQALINTIQAAKCYYFAPPAGAVAGVSPVVNIPAGSYSIGGNISIPPGLDLEGVGGTEHGTLTVLTTTDTTQPMMTQVASETFVCSGTTYTASGAGATIGNMTLHGGGAAAKTDVGVFSNAGTDYIHNMTFVQFGGPGRTGNGSLNNRGDHILAVENLEWYYFSGAYNPSSFADTNPHGSLEFTDVDGNWDHIEETGVLQDSGYFNRYYLVGILWAGRSLTNSFIQINPHDVWVGTIGYSPIISSNSFDDGWWDSVHLVGSNTAIHVTNNLFLGYCTSPTLNPANFPTNPGGITTDPNCAGIESLNLGSYIALNSFEELGAIWLSWPVGDVFAGANVIGGTPSVIEQPGNTVFGNIGGPQINIGSDLSKSIYGITAYIGFGGWPGGGPNIPLTNTSLGGNNFAHYVMADPATSNYTGITGGVPDTYITIAVGQNDTITPSASIFTCTGKPIIGRASTASSRDNIHLFWNNNNQFLEEVCPGAATVASSETVTFSATPTFSNATRASMITLTGNVTSFTLAAGTDGQEKTLTFCQDATGSRTISGVPPNVHGFFTIGSTLSKCSAQHFTYSTVQTAWLADSTGVINQ